MREISEFVAAVSILRWFRARAQIRVLVQFGERLLLEAGMTLPPKEIALAGEKPPAQ